jgi:hypothetical protein
LRTLTLNPLLHPPGDVTSWAKRERLQELVFDCRPRRTTDGPSRNNAVATGLVGGLFWHGHPTAAYASSASSSAFASCRSAVSKPSVNHP